MRYLGAACSDSGIRKQANADNICLKNLSYRRRQLAEVRAQLIGRQKISEYGKRQRIRPGTTVGSMLIMENKYLIVHVEDSRIYEISGRVRKLTKDHTCEAVTTCRSGREP